jgi:hypothetical protein
MACIDRWGKGIALLINDDGYLLATVTDGDIRRAILAGLDLNLKITQLVENRGPAFRSAPITAQVGTPADQLLHTMTEKGLRQIPLLDDDGRMINLVHLSELVKEYELPLRAVVMAGGFGTRLRPLTDDIPKPMLPLGTRPLLQLIVEQLKDADGDGRRTPRRKHEHGGCQFADGCGITGRRIEFPSGSN